MNFEFVTGISIGICVMQVIFIYYINRDLRLKKEKVIADFEKGIEQLSTAHKGVVEALSEVDRKASEVKLKLDMSETLKHQARNPLGPRGI